MPHPSHTADARLTGESEDLSTAVANAKAEGRPERTSGQVVGTAGLEPSLSAEMRSSARRDPTDEYGRTPLHRAATDGDETAVAQLLTDGACPDARDRNGETPLHKAAMRPISTVASVLVRHGADCNVRDSLGRTPLHVAARARSRLVVKLLLEAGASHRVRDAFGRCPLYYCHNHGETWDTFEELGIAACQAIQPEVIDGERRYASKRVDCGDQEACEAGAQEYRDWADLREDDVVIRRLVYQAAADAGRMLEDEIHPDDRLVEDLGCDSMDSMILVMDLEDEFGLTIPDEEAENLRTVADAIELVRHRLASAAPHSP